VHGKKPAIVDIKKSVSDGIKIYYKLHCKRCRTLNALCGAESQRYKYEVSNNIVDPTYKTLYNPSTHTVQFQLQCLHPSFSPLCKSETSLSSTESCLHLSLASVPKQITSTINSRSTIINRELASQEHSSLRRGHASHLRLAGILAFLASGTTNRLPHGRR
jgi:hypothetical protein